MTIEVLPDPVLGWLNKNPRPSSYKGFWPATDAQGAAMDCSADILLLGGSAGSLKTSTILADLHCSCDQSCPNIRVVRVSGDVEAGA